MYVHWDFDACFVWGPKGWVQWKKASNSSQVLFNLSHKWHRIKQSGNALSSLCTEMSVNKL